jgi:2-dehydro-3-deoxy-D-arabinonate dehydratase
MLIAMASRTSAGQPVVVDDTGRVRPLDVPSLSALLRLPLTDIRAMVEEASAGAAPDSLDDVTLGPPIDGRTEVWAAGVTYRRSQEARIEESGNRDIYSMVYDAPRPELFFKAVSWRVVGSHEDIAVRHDSELNVPEPELAVVTNALGEIVGYTICDDVSSRTLEATNPLYLPQAKIYTGSCSLGPAIRPSWELAPDPHFDIRVRVHRDESTVWSGSTSTDKMKRSFTELVDHLFTALDFPEGAVLATGTGLVPEITFTLRDGDVVDIEVPGIGRLVNGVRETPPRRTPVSASPLTLGRNHAD